MRLTVNRIYGIQLLVTITIRFIMITTQLINTYKVIQDPKLADSVTHSLIAIYLFLHFSKLFMISAVSDNTATKVSWNFIYFLFHTSSGRHLKQNIVKNDRYYYSHYNPKWFLERYRNIPTFILKRNKKNNSNINTNIFNSSFLIKEQTTFLCRVETQEYIFMVYGT